MFHQAARAMAERYCDGRLAARSRKTPTGMKKLRNWPALVLPLQDPVGMPEVEIQKIKWGQMQ